MKIVNLNRKKIFIRFLKENNCYKQYCKNYNNTLDELYESNEYNGELNISNEIFDAFSWVSTKEGFSFWDDVDDKWTIFLIKIKK